MIKKSRGERVFFVFNTVILTLICVMTIYPFANTMALSFNDGWDANRGGIYIWPRVWTTRNYQTTFRDRSIINGYVITVSRTALGVVTTLFCIGLLAYSLSKKYLLFATPVSESVVASPAS